MSGRCWLPVEDHATGAEESVADLGLLVLPAARTEKLETLRIAWTLEVCRVSSAFDRLEDRPRLANLRAGSVILWRTTRHPVESDSPG